MKPKLHFTPTKNWMNDPNGFIYYKGEYHLFYQHFPYDTKWGTMHWGHKTSKDLVHWQDQGIALYPSVDFDRNGCFSGSAIEVDGKLYLYYTAIVYNKLNPKNIHVTGDTFIASQAMMISPDGKIFNPETKQVVVPVLEEPLGHPTHTRDPKVWKENDTYYMVLGSQYAYEKDTMKGQLLFYKSQDGIHWDYLNAMKHPELNSNMWECPDLFKLEKAQDYTLIMSPENILRDGKNYPSHALWGWVDFDPSTGEASLKSELSYLDYGLDLYAPQTNIDKDGRRVMISWLRMPQPSEDGKWNGLFTYPRVITNHDGHLYFNVHPNIESLFTKEIDTITFDEPIKISVEMNENSKINLGGYRIWMQDQALHTSREQVFPSQGTLFNSSSPIGTHFHTPKVGDTCHIDIYLDTQVIEIYVNNGQYVLSNIVYSMTSDINIKNVDHLKIYQVNE